METGPETTGVWSTYGLSELLGDDDQDYLQNPLRRQPWDNPDSKTKALPYVAAMMGRYGTIPRKTRVAPKGTFDRLADPLSGTDATLALDPNRQAARREKAKSEFEAGKRKLDRLNKRPLHQRAELPPAQQRTFPPPPLPARKSSAAAANASSLSGSSKPPPPLRSKSLGARQPPPGSAVGAMVSLVEESGANAQGAVGVAASTTNSIDWANRWQESLAEMVHDSPTSHDRSAVGNLNGSSNVPGAGEGIMTDEEMFARVAQDRARRARKRLELEQAGVLSPSSRDGNASSQRRGGAQAHGAATLDVDGRYGFSPPEPPFPAAAATLETPSNNRRRRASVDRRKPVIPSMKAGKSTKLRQPLSTADAPKSAPPQWELKHRRSGGGGAGKQAGAQRGLVKVRLGPIAEPRNQQRRGGGIDGRSDFGNSNPLPPPTKYAWSANPSSSNRSDAVGGNAPTKKVRLGRKGGGAKARAAAKEKDAAEKAEAATAAAAKGPQLVPGAARKAALRKGGGRSSKPGNAVAREFRQAAKEAAATRNEAEAFLKQLKATASPASKPKTNLKKAVQRGAAPEATPLPKLTTMPDVVVEVMSPAKASSPAKSAVPAATKAKNGGGGGGAFFMTQIDDGDDDDDNGDVGGIFITQAGSSKVKPVAGVSSRKPLNVRGALNKMENLSLGGHGEIQTRQF